MFNIFSKKNKVTDITWLGIDVHSHILPCIDDGSPDIETSLQFVKSLNALGFNHLIATPHIFKELYPNTAESISLAKEKLKDALNKTNISITLEAGAEYMIDQDFTLNE